MRSRPFLPGAKLGRGLLIGAVAGLLALVLARVLVLDWFEVQSFDRRLQWRPGSRLRDEAVKVLIVAVDEKTLGFRGSVSKYSRWPFPRGYYGEVLDLLHRAGARAVGFDLRFEEPQPAEDPKLAAALRDAGNVFLGVRFDPLSAYFVDAVDLKHEMDGALLCTLPRSPSPDSRIMKGAALPPPMLARAARAMGSLTTAPELDGVVRRFPLVVPYVRPNDRSGEVRLYASLPLLMAARMLNVPLKDVRVRLGDAVEIGGRRIPINDSGEVVINYYGGFRAMHHLSYIDVAEKAYPPRYFRDMAVLIGNTASGAFDIQVTPYGGQYPGVEAQATVLQNILDGSVIAKSPPWASLLLVLGSALLIGALRPCRLSTQFIAAVGAATVLVAAGYLLLLFNSLWVEIVRPVFAIGISFLLVSFDTYREAQRAQARVEGAVQILAELTTAMSGTRNPAELCVALEDSATRVLRAGKARLEIDDAEMREHLRIPLDALAATESAPQTTAPLLARGRQIGRLSLESVQTDVHPALVNALTLFLGVILDNSALSGEVRASFLGLTITLADIIESKDRYTAGHCTRVMEYSACIGQRMGLSEDALEQLRYGALLHDLGKVAIPEAVLNKPGRLTDEEMHAMRQHPILGDQWLNHQNRLTAVRAMVASHHEWYDGNGYPAGLAGEEIPLGGRILAVADVWDALTTDRPYRRAIGFKEAREFIVNGRGTQFDPKVTDFFLAWLDEDPALQSLPSQSTLVPPFRA